MAYSNVLIANMALNRIGVKRITSFDEDSVQADKVREFFDVIRDEVLEAKDWRFAKRREELAQSSITPEYGWDYAYGLPAGFMRMCKTTGEFPVSKEDPPVSPYTYPWKIETLSDGNLYLLMDYDSTDNDDGVFINCILRITDPAKYTASFISALAWRLGAELSIGLTEGKEKFEFCMRMYGISLTQAESLNQSFDSLKDEIGSDSWDQAGR